MDDVGTVCERALFGIQQIDPSLELSLPFALRTVSFKVTTAVSANECRIWKRALACLHQLMLGL
jgi:hypothetical protein